MYIFALCYLDAELFLSKRILEAEMSELRSSRDSQLVEANERVRMAERAILAATSRNKMVNTDGLSFNKDVLSTTRAGDLPNRAAPIQAIIRPFKSKTKVF